VWGTSSDNGVARSHGKVLQRASLHDAPSVNARPPNSSHDSGAFNLQSTTQMSQSSGAAQQLTRITTGLSSRARTTPYGASVTPSK
jgi:hypothetical protein